ncbi:MAG: hypothetical protein SFV21_00270 [Rhodospirillaceae bacterium]|nr:hypothetical protein [Rhodospirillaceae bacterium]
MTAHRKHAATPRHVMEDARLLYLWADYQRVHGLLTGGFGPGPGIERELERHLDQIESEIMRQPPMTWEGLQIQEHLFHTRRERVAAIEGHYDPLPFAPGG